MTVKDKLQLQFGKQSVFGTAVAGTVKAMGVEDVQFLPQVNVKQFGGLRNSLAPAHFSELEDVRGGVSVEQTALYEDICYPLEGLFGEATPSGGGPYTRDYAAADAYTPRIQTAIYGVTGTDVRKLTGGLVTRFGLSGEASENDTEIKASYEMIGKDISAGTLAALSDRTVSPIMASHAALYIDDWTGTIGTTAIASTWFAFDLAVDLNRILKKYMGSLSPESYETLKAEAGANMLRMSVEANATSVAYLTAILAASGVFKKQVRLKFTSGTNILQVDFAGVQVQAPTLYDDNNGVISFDLELHPEYNTSLGNWIKVQSVNGVAALP